MRTPDSSHNLGELPDADVLSALKADPAGAVAELVDSMGAGEALRRLQGMRQEMLDARIISAVVAALPAESRALPEARFLSAVARYDAEMNSTDGAPDWEAAADELAAVARELGPEADAALVFFVHNQAFLAARNAGSAVKKAQGDPSAFWARCAQHAAAATEALNKQTDEHRRNEQAGYFFYNLSRHLAQNEGRVEEARGMYAEAGRSRLAYLKHLESQGMATDAYATQVWKVPFDALALGMDEDGPVSAEEERRIVMTYVINPKFAVRKDKEEEWKRRYGDIPYPGA